jgi:hypothetical protein
MKRFRYRLEPVLRHRGFQERELQVELARLTGELAREVGALQTLRDECAALVAQLEASTDPRRRLLALDMLAGSSQAMAAQQLRVDEARTHVDARRLEVVRARQEREKLEKHKARLAQEHVTHYTRLEENAAQDVATTRYVHRTRGEESAGEGGHWI